jgi:hypothetical protein
LQHDFIRFIQKKMSIKVNLISMKAICRLLLFGPTAVAKC